MRLCKPYPKQHRNGGIQHRPGALPVRWLKPWGDLRLRKIVVKYRTRLICLVAKKEGVYAPSFFVARYTLKIPLSTAREMTPGAPRRRAKNALAPLSASVIPVRADVALTSHRHIPPEMALPKTERTGRPLRR